MKRSTLAVVLVLFVASLCASLAPVTADDWLYWRGPGHNGVSNELGLVDDWSPKDNKNVLWTSPIGGRATPIVLNDRVYLNCRTEHNVNDPEEKIHAGEQVVCWDAKTGEIIWRDVLNVFQTDIPAPRVGWASMAGDKETNSVILHSVSGLLRCYSADGDILWEHSLLEEYGTIRGYGGRTQSPIIDEDRVIVSFLAANWGETKGPGPLHYYYAFDKRTGELLWVSAPGTAPQDTNYSGAFVTVIDGQRLLIGGNGDGGIYAMNARTGEKVWGFRMSQRGLNASPVTDGKYVYISHGEDNIDNTEFGRVQCIDASGSGDITETNSVWRKDGIKAGYTGLVVHDGILYLVSDTGVLYAFDSQTGDELWTHTLGTVGKGSPVWADGKLYVMEVNGNVHILKTSRTSCESLSHVELQALNGSGMDEIYASPAISNGRVFLVTRDRTICLGTAADTSETPAVTLPPENPVANEIALIQLRPFEVALHAGETVNFKLHAFDANGNFIKEVVPEELTADESLADGVVISGGQLSAASISHDAAGLVTCQVGDLAASSRVRVFNGDAVWSWDFEDFSPMQVPPTWIRAFVKLQPTEVDGTMAMKVAGLADSRGRPSHMVWLGTPEMKNYTVQSDIMITEQARRMANIGITNQRYNLIVKGNNNKLDIQSWAAHLRLGASQRFVAEPGTWYTMKLVVDVVDGKANIKGKVWKREEAEPEAWTIEAVDPRANEKGSPGLYVYALSESYFDNIKVTQNDN